MHKPIFSVNRADVSTDDLLFIHQQVGADVFLLPWIIADRIGKTADLLSLEFGQVKPLFELNLIVILIDISEGLRNNNLRCFDGFLGYLPAKTLQKCNAGSIVGNCCIVVF